MLKGCIAQTEKKKPIYLPVLQISHLRKNLESSDRVKPQSKLDVV